MGDFSIANNLDANAAELNLQRNQSKLSTTARRLASGLRIQSAADDPSGLAISERLLDRVDALKTSSQNVDTARSAAVVADGALSSITNILLRIRALAVEASSSVESNGDRSKLQTEIDSLLHEIDRIAQNTNFNGQPLLNGSHAGFQAAQDATLRITANAALASGTPGTGTDLLVSSAVLTQTAAQPQIYFALQQAVTASPSPQTVKVSDAAYIQPGTVFVMNGGLVKVQSVDAAAGTITATFAKNGGTGDIVSAFIGGNSTAAVSAGVHLMTITGTAQPLYAGQVLQVDPGSFATNDLVVVQKVVSPTSFIADFNLPHGAGAQIYSENGTFVPANYGPGNYTFSFGGTPTDGPAIGSAAYVIETTNGSFPPPNGTMTKIVATGTIVGGSLSSETVQFTQKIPNYFGGAFELISGVGAGSAPVTTTDDGTIKLQVVNTGVSIAVQETFYDTASQTQTVSPYLLAPGEQSMLFDGVVTTLGSFTTADVGTSSYIKVQQASAAITNPDAPAFAVHSGANEGDEVQIGIPDVSSAALRVSTVTVIGAPGTDPTLAAEDSIGQVDFALDRVLGIRATLGAQIVRLGEDGQNDDTGAGQMQASESSIADANIPAETSDFALEQTEVQIGLSVLSQANNLPEQILKLFR